MFTFDFEAIGTGWFIDIDGVLELESENHSQQIISLTHDFEESYSRFKDTSLVGQLNKNKILQNPTVEFLEMLKLAEELKEVTQGAFDVMIGKRLSDLGYDKSLSFKETKSTDLNENFIKIEANCIKIGADSVLDLGGIGKGYLIDKVSMFIKSKGYKQFSVNAGGDIYSFGTQDKSFYLENPFDTTQAIGEIVLKEGGIACSSASKRNWKANDKQVHHLINMKSQMPVDDISAVFTYGKTTTNADLGSTAIFVLDKNVWPDIAKLLNIEYLVVFSSGKYFQTQAYPGRMYS